LENRKIIYYQKTDSTNMRIEDLARNGAAHGTVVIAKEQTAGRGRRGRRWESPPDGNIYMSVLLRPEIEADKAPMLTLVMAYSIATVLQNQGYEDVQIKWPNDLIISRKKVCGILTEMHLQGTEIDYVTVGVGINANTKQFPSELQDKATSLSLESGRTEECDLLIENILQRFDEEYNQFLKEKNLSFLQETYNQLLANREREVQVLEPGNAYTAYALGINQNGELIVRTHEGTEQAVFAGEVSVRGVYGYI